MPSLIEIGLLVLEKIFFNTVKTAMGDLCGRRPPAIPDRLLKARMRFQR